MPRYTVLSPFRRPGEKQPLAPGATIELPATQGRRLVDAGVLSEGAADSAGQSEPPDDVGALEEELASVEAALAQQVQLTQAAETRAAEAEAQRDAAAGRARQAEAELAALRSTPPADPPPAGQGNPTPPAKPKKAAPAK